MVEQKNAQQNENAIYTDSLIIRQNIMEWGNTMIQLSNVCSISTKTFVKEYPFPTQSLTWGGIGLFILLISSFIKVPLATIVGLLFIAVAGTSVYSWWKKKETPDRTMTLNISMNSGYVFQFIFYDEQFKLRVLKVLETIISQGQNLNIGDINVDIKNNNIQGNLDFMNIRR